MTNKQRVNRIKTLIYTFVILVLFLPLVLMSVLSFRMIGLAQKMSDKLDQISIAASQTESNPSGDDYVIEPEGQSTKNGSITPQDVEVKNSGGVNDKTSDASGNQPEAGVLTPPNGNMGSNGGSLLGSQNPSQVNQDAVSGINNNNSGKLNSDSLSQNGNIATGNGVTIEDPDGNPLTGR